MLILSSLTQALLATYKSIESKQLQDESLKLEVSQAVSFFGSLYEKMRNAVEFRESHLLRKTAIERILRRRLMLNQQPHEYTELLIRELMWGKYLTNEAISEKRVKKLTSIIKQYLNLRHRALEQLENTNQMREVSDWIIEVLACKMEHFIEPNDKNLAMVNYIYQWLYPSINIAGANDETRNIQTFLAVHDAYNRTDQPMLTYYFLQQYGEENLFKDFWRTYSMTKLHVTNPIRRKITKYIQKQLAPFLILDSLLSLEETDVQEELLSNNQHNLDSGKLRESILSNEKMLAQIVTKLCKQKYSLVTTRLRRAAVRSIIYLFITKMLIALILEIPVDRLLAGHVEIVPLAINILFPPGLMFLIALFILPPGKANTKRIIRRIIDILTLPAYNAERRSFTQQSRVSKPLLTLIFTAIYSITFFLVFGLIIWLLARLGFNIGSQIIFLFFLTVVSFFAYRIKQIPNEYVFKEREGILTPAIDFLTLPILTVGKRLSEEVAKLNFITFIFDFILEAPFKAIFELFEEWVGYLRSKREEIT